VVFVDVETTGVDVASDEVIEIAMVAFDYDERGHVRAVHPPFTALRDPGRPIPVEVTALTGLTDEIVAGHVLDEEDLREFLKQAALVVAHNAEFDRKFCERLCGAFADLPWACSLNEVPWREELSENGRIVDDMRQSNLDRLGPASHASVWLPFFCGTQLLANQLPHPLQCSIPLVADSPSHRDGEGGAIEWQLVHSQPEGAGERGARGARHIRDQAARSKQERKGSEAFGHNPDRTAQA
jgi:DNA polymerase III epsilon subunit-like protein